jgi:cysteine-S-conjugate beta-lyase
MSEHKITALIHHPYRAPEGFEAPSVPVHKASTVFFPNCAAVRERGREGGSGYTYGLSGTPTSLVLAQRIATLEGGLHALLLPSGLAAISLVNLALLVPGDQVLIPDNAYGPLKVLARHELTRLGIGHRFYDPGNLEALSALLQAQPKLLWVEAPGSVTMEFPDLIAMVQLARGGGVIVALDNTWGAGLAFNPFDLAPGSPGDPVEVDISIQALTKYPSGGGDVLMGSVTTRAAPLHQQLRACHMRMGWGVGLNDVEMVLRGLPSMALRYAAQDQSARSLAQWWAQQPAVSQVLHPALPSSPGHAHWQRVSPGHAAGLFSVVFDARYGQAQIDAFIDHLQRFKIGYSWAGPISLVMPYELSVLRSSVPWRGALVRFSVGLEATDDLIADCAQALTVLSTGAS